MTRNPSGPRPTGAAEKGFFRFCPDCGGPLDLDEIHGRRRPNCPACGFVQWRNPGVGVAGIVTEDDVTRRCGVTAVRDAVRDPAWEPAPGEGRVLLVRRRDPRHPGWCLPCGWVEYDEDIREALMRELLEETGLEVCAGRIFAVHSNFHDSDRHSVGIWFRARPHGGTPRAGDDADRIGFYHPGRVTVPLAFPTDRLVLAALASRRR